MALKDYVAKRCQEDGLTAAKIDDPDWGENDHVHNWRNYIPWQLQECWQDLPLEARQAAYCVASEIAAREYWD